MYGLEFDSRSLLFCLIETITIKMEINASRNDRIHKRILTRVSRAKEKNSANILVESPSFLLAVYHGSEDEIKERRIFDDPEKSHYTQQR